MTDMKMAIVMTEAVSFIMMMILLYSQFFEIKIRDRRTDCFILCVICTAFSLAMDIPSWLFDTTPGMDIYVVIVTLLALLGSLGSVSALSYYTAEVISASGKETRIHARIISAVCAACTVFMIVGTVLGKTFSMNNGVFIYGPWYSVSAIVAFAGLVYMFTIVLINRKYIGLHDTLAFSAYVILPAIAVVPEIINPQMSLSLPAGALAALILYVMLQSRHMAELHLRGEILDELSNKDILTGLLNRRAFETVLEKCKQQDVLNIAYCDLNGLKYTNDASGHAAGDARLVEFAEVLKRNFSVDCIFRISGDEFVIIIGKLPEPSFEARIQKLKQDLFELDDLASVGIACGAGNEAIKLLELSEKRMYEHKKECYARHPEYVRD